MRLTDCDRGNDWQGRVQIFWGISKPITVGDSAIFAFSKLGKHLLENGEGWFYRSDNILTQRDPAKLDWSLLPDGERGVRNDKFGSVQEEHNIVSLGGDDLYCIYRTTMGYPCQSYSRDGGQTWSEPEPAAYTPGGRVIKHPRACPKLWRTAGSNYLLWFHNHGGHDFKGRNPAWIAGGVARDGKMHWSQPEIVLYDDDPEVRMSYPDLIEQDGKYWITETQKTVARVHPIDARLLEGMWRQVSADASQAKAASDAVVPRVTDPQDASKYKFVDLQSGGGFSLELRLRVSSAETVGTLLEAGDLERRGWQLVAEEGGRLRLKLVDGQHRSQYASDPGLLVQGDHHVIITVDGGPKIISCVVEGMLNDGGRDQASGWARFDPNIHQVPGGLDVQVGRPSPVEVVEWRIHRRALRNYEAIENYRATLSRR
jgi:hypothetical protein